MNRSKPILKPEFEAWLKESRIFNYMIGMMGPGTGAALQMLLSRVEKYREYFPSGLRAYAVKIAYMMIMLDLAGELDNLRREVENLKTQVAELRTPPVKPD